MQKLIFRLHLNLKEKFEVMWRASVKKKPLSYLFLLVIMDSSLLLCAVISTHIPQIFTKNGFHCTISFKNLSDYTLIFIIKSSLITLRCFVDSMKSNLINLDQIAFLLSSLLSYPCMRWILQLKKKFNRISVIS